MTQRGYTLLFSIIVSTVVLSVAAFILTVSRKQFLLSSAARDSTMAIYAADSGIQCALETYSSTFFATTSSQILNCNDVRATSLWSTYASTNSAVSDMGFGSLPGFNQVFQTAIPYKIFFNNGTCAVVTVSDGYDNIPSHMTVIDARGYNIGKSTGPGTGTCPDTNPREIERAIRLVYHG